MLNLDRKAFIRINIVLLLVLCAADGGIALPSAGRHELVVESTRKCGPICLYLVYRLLGKWDISLDSLVSACCCQGKGTSIAKLQEVATSGGLHAKALRLTPGMLLDLPYLAILITEPWIDGTRHFVLFTGANGEYLHLFNPPYGCSMKHVSDFTQTWGGEALVLSAMPIDIDEIVDPRVSGFARGCHKVIVGAFAELAGLLFLRMPRIFGDTMLIS